MRKSRHVVMVDGRWAVRAEGVATQDAFYRTQSEAWERCKAIARKERTVAVLHGRDGAIRSRASYTPDRLKD
jgi:hypothetical protein